MNQVDGVVRMQADALKALLEQSRDDRCAELGERAALQAAEMRTRARRKARERVARAVAEERARMEREVRAVEAEIETEHRRRARRRDLALIEAGGEALREALQRRWTDEGARRDWAQTVVREAAEVLLGRDWVLEHPADWPAAERDDALAFAADEAGARCTAQASDAVAAGLRIRSDGALVDMSIAGLLANRARIDGQLLAELADEAEGETR
ncbi:hypothetical protein [Wenzhouxiangella sp. XN24]|uniref:hypothetical protein n=1 Tax=Wenzhouxiangella sp. XN24 TaxID=2713569 RepID=UPI0013E9B585|nr:hypothetical protein [Wenzhouxiangella sp. XN24]NGX17053.1 hypothetical protein [Wenzhouxiangella sp. XN24]